MTNKKSYTLCQTRQREPIFLMYFKLKKTESIERLRLERTSGGHLV